MAVSFTGDRGPHGKVRIARIECPDDVHRVVAGIRRQRVATETPRFRTTSRGDPPPFKSFRADSTLAGVIRRLRPPDRPRRGQAGPRAFGPPFVLVLLDSCL